MLVDWYWELDWERFKKKIERILKALFLYLSLAGADCQIVAEDDS